MRISKALDALSTWTAKVAMWLIIPQVVALVYEVVARYLFNRPTIWSLDLTWMVFGAHFMLGGAYTLLVKGHITVDVFYERLSPYRKTLISLLCYLILFFPVMVAFVKGGWDFAALATAYGERSQQTSWRPLIWPFKWLMVVAFVLLLLQGLSEFIKLTQQLRQQRRG